MPMVDRREDPEQGMVGRLGVGGWLRAQGPGERLSDGGSCELGRWMRHRCGTEWPAGVRVEEKLWASQKQSSPRMHMSSSK